MLVIREISKRYVKTVAVQGISFTVEAGEIVGLLGPNGAGKTTTIGMLLGILEPDGGSIEFMGQSMAEHGCKIRRSTNFAAVYAHAPGNLTVMQNLKVFGLLYDVPNLPDKIETLLTDFDLQKFRNTKAGLLSSGELSRLNLAKALINEPKLLLLDEPTASLDPSVAEGIRETIRKYAQEKNAAVLLTSHNMTEIEKMCSRVLFLSRGNILLSGDPSVLPMRHGKKNLEELFIAIAREPLTINNHPF